MIKIIGIKVIDRIKESGLTQRVLSGHAKAITTRLGFHEVTDEICSREACIILHTNCSTSESEALRMELESLGGVVIREITFDSGNDEAHPELPGDAPEVLAMMVERNQDTISEVQRILTSYGCNIRTRLGVNEMIFGKPAGLIILELKGDSGQRLLLVRDLASLAHVHVRTISF